MRLSNYKTYLSSCRRQYGADFWKVLVLLALSCAAGKVYESQEGVDYLTERSQGALSVRPSALESPARNFRHGKKKKVTP